MRKVKVSLGPRSYTVYIAKNALNSLKHVLNKHPINTPIFVITNKQIASLHGASLKKAIGSQRKKVLFYEVPNSEKAKSFSVYIKTVKNLARFARKTKPLVIAFGGGVVGDLAGFVASAYRRGVPYIQVPTTLLSQVDSAIGGKVAIDIKEAKNIVGDFYQPKAVICDLNLLKSLPKNTIKEGLSEIIKYGVIKDKALFEFLEKNLKKVLSLHGPSIEYVISRCCQIKASVVSKDEFDAKDVRAILNFGHTIGHAIEAASSYKSTSHGKAVALGMIMASIIARELGVLKEGDYKRIHNLVKKISSTKKIRLNSKKIFNALSYDKKFTRGVNKFILPIRIGCVKIVENISKKLIRNVLNGGIS